MGPVLSRRSLEERHRGFSVREGDAMWNKGQNDVSASSGDGRETGTKERGQPPEMSRQRTDLPESLQKEHT